MRNLFAYLIFVLAFTFFSIGALAQTSNQTVSAPFKAGEVLKYEAKISRAKILSVSIADLIFRVEKSPDAQGKEYVFKAEAKSKGSLLKLVRFSFFQTFETLAEQTEGGFRVLKTIRHDEQRDRVRDSESIFDYQNGKVTYTETDPKTPTRMPRKLAAAIQSPMLDLVSSIYSLRFLPLMVGKTFDVQMSDSGLVYTIPVRVTGREILKTDIGKIWTFKVEPQVFGENKPVSGKGNMIIWITDDVRRLPVRSQISASVGKIDIKLQSADGTVAVKN